MRWRALLWRNVAARLPSFKTDQAWGHRMQNIDWNSYFLCWHPYVHAEEMSRYFLKIFSIFRSLSPMFFSTFGPVGSRAFSKPCFLLKVLQRTWLTMLWVFSMSASTWSSWSKQSKTIIYFFIFLDAFRDYYSLFFFAIKEGDYRGKIPILRYSR